MLDHIGFSVTDFEKSKAFYDAALAPLGYALVMEFQGIAGYGPPGRPQFWFNLGDKVEPRIHVALVAKDRAAVDAFYAAAMAAGGQDNGPPGIREIYHPHYYGAFVLDPDGHNIEAVCHTPE